MTIVVTPNAGFMSAAGMGVRDMPPSQKADSMEQIHRDLIFIGQHLSDPAFTFSAGGTQKLGEAQASALDINGAGSYSSLVRRSSKRTNLGRDL